MSEHEHPLTKIRNIGIMAHIDAGKTTTSERVLFYCSASYKLGEVHEGTATMDFMVQEQERGITIGSAATTVDWKDYRLSLIDTPGHVDFTAEVERCLRVLDGAIALFCAVGGVQPQTEQVWRQSEKYRVPKICFINKMDRVGADFDGVVSQIRDILGANPTVMTYPIGAGETFEGVVDILRMRSITFDQSSNGIEMTYGEVPEHLRDICETAHLTLVEQAAEQDDNLLEKFFEEGTLSDADILKGIRKGCLARRLVPVYCGTAFKNKGVQPLLDGVTRFLPSPLDVGAVHAYDDESVVREPKDDEPFSALAFKIVADKHMGRVIYVRIYSGTLRVGETILNATRGERGRVGRIFRMQANKQEQLSKAHAGDIIAIAGLGNCHTGDTLCSVDEPIILETIDFPAPVISVAISPASRNDNEKLGAALHTLAAEDPTFTVAFDQETGETIISGMGELHLEVLVDRLKREFKVECEVGRPEVAYRETIAGGSDGAYKHVKQSGGRGQYAHVVMKLESMEPGEGFEFVDEVKGGNIPTEYIPAVQKGIVASLDSGPLAGYPVVDVRAIVYDGSSHEVDSSEYAFSEAGRQCFRSRFMEASPLLLEPVMMVEVTVPEEYMGAATGSISQCRGRIEGMSDRGSNKVVRGFAPLGEMFGYSNTIRTLTQGRGTFAMQLHGYEPVPKKMAEEIIEKRRKENKIRG